MAKKDRTRGTWKAVETELYYAGRRKNREVMWDVSGQSHLLPGGQEEGIS